MLQHHTNGIQGVQPIPCAVRLHTVYRLWCVGVASHAPSACASAPPGGLAGRAWAGFVVGFMFVAFGCCGVCVDGNAMQRDDCPPTGLPTPVPILFL